MGTRNLTCVYLDGECKIAQYGQWDGYPSGQGATILTFLSKLTPELRSKLLDQLRSLAFYTASELAEIGKEKDWPKKYPHLSRDLGAEILDTILRPAVKLGPISKEIGFANDSVFCEWAYVVDLDSNVLEVFTGFNPRPLKPSERFYTGKPPHRGSSDSFYPIRLLKSYPLDALPTLELFESELEALNEKRSKLRGRRQTAKTEVEA